MPATPAPIDYDLAVSTARRLVPAGPRLTLSEAADVVNELRDVTARAEEHVRTVTGLSGPGAPGPATVVDRAGWAAGNVDGFRAVLEPLSEQLFAGKSPNRAAEAVTRRVTGVQMGGVLAWLSSKVLGQYEVFLPPDQAAGRLTLVAPNIVETEQRLGVDPSDFRLWVALHEVTHRTQFTAVDWLHDHVRSEIGALLTASRLDDPTALLGRLKDGIGQKQSLVELVQTPEQKLVLDRVTAFMSLLEGHAEHVMDGVGPSVVPSVVDIRRRFQQRRAQRGNPLDRLLRRALGLDLKALQYAEGKVFVDHAVRQLGMAGFNRVWTSPETLPTREEIRAPQAWVDRVGSLPALPTGPHALDA